MDLDWYDFTPEDLEGRGWSKTRSPFDRLPECLENLGTAWECSHSSTGMCLFFNTDSPEIYARWELGEDCLGEDNFNVIAHDGVDLYVQDKQEKRWRWAGSPGHNTITGTKPEVALIKDMAPGITRKCRMYMPLRNVLRKIAVGVVKGASFKKVAPRKSPAIVYYGTSIIHGAYTIRSGLGTAQLLGRAFDMPLINLGFSGGAKLEPEMAQALTELNAGFYIIDPFHNVNPQILKERESAFLEILCSAKPQTPVFIISAPLQLQSWLRPALKAVQEEQERIFSGIARRMAKKYPNLHFINGKNFYGSDEVSIDGTHPNDQAFANMAKVLEKKIRAILKNKRTL